MRHLHHTSIWLHIYIHTILTSIISIKVAEATFSPDFNNINGIELSCYLAPTPGYRSLSFCFMVDWRAARAFDKVVSAYVYISIHIAIVCTYCYCMCILLLYVNIAIVCTYCYCMYILLLYVNIAIVCKYCYCMYILLLYVHIAIVCTYCYCMYII
jgi:hypothetical protein